MSSSSRIALLLTLLVAGLLQGCATNPDVEKTRESAVPWGRPADWEGTIPGMGR